MCLIIAKPSGKKGLPKISNLLKGWYGNSDGAGYAYSKKGDNVVVYKKGFMTIKSFIEAYESEPFYAEPDEYSVVLHFRIATHGGKLSSLTHPFIISSPIENPLSYSGEKSVVFHNGARIGTAVVKAGYSDTMEYAETVLSQLGKEDIAWLEGTIGYNKLVVLHPNAELQIVNAQQGMEKDGIWFSNSYSV